MEHQEEQEDAPGVRPVARTLNSLPLNPPGDYSPYFGLEFDLAVQDYCRQSRNSHSHIQQHKQQQQQQQAHSEQQMSPVKAKEKMSPMTKMKFKLKQAQQQLQQQQQQPTKTRHSSFGNATAPMSPLQKIVRNCKVVVSGDVAVGKTSLVNRFGHGAYSSAYRTTIGVDFDLQQYNILGQPYVLQIWDTAGLERFRCITNSYYRGCQVALLVFDMSNMSTLANVFKWKDEVLSASKTYDQLARELDTFTGRRSLDATQRAPDDSSSGPLLFLVGTKCDLAINESSRAFIKEQANKIAAVLQAELWLVSSRTGENVEQLFNRIAALSFNRCILTEINRMKFEASTLGACLKEKILAQQRELWSQSSKLIKITKRKDGDDRRSRCINIQCVIK